MRGWSECPRCAGTGSGEGSRECGYGRVFRPQQPERVVFVEPIHREEFSEESRAYFAKLMASCRAIDPDFGMATDLPTEPEPDYEALGYQQTHMTEVDHMENVTGFLASVTAVLPIIGRLDRVSEKDIPAATDIVDSADSDSYK